MRIKNLIAPLTIALISMMAHAGLTPNGAINPISSSTGMSRVIVRNNSVLFAEAAGASYQGASIGGDSDSDTVFPEWVIADSNTHNFFFNSNAMAHEHTARIDLYRVAGSTQGIANQSLEASFAAVTPVAYSISVLITPTVIELSDNANAFISYDFFVGFGGSAGAISESGTMAVGAGSPAREFMYSGTFEPSGSFSLITMNANSVLNVLIDSPGERAQVAYSMFIRAEFTAVPSPSVLGVLGMGSLIATRRRRQ